MQFEKKKNTEFLTTQIDPETICIMSKKSISTTQIGPKTICIMSKQSILTTQIGPETICIMSKQWSQMSIFWIKKQQERPVLIFKMYRYFFGRENCTGFRVADTCIWVFGVCWQDSSNAVGNPHSLWILQLHGSSNVENLRYKQNLLCWHCIFCCP